jgi:hypothetical protein
MRRSTASISASAVSAVSSVTTAGVFVTLMPRALAQARSTRSTPIPMQAMISRSGNASMISAGQACSA